MPLSLLHIPNPGGKKKKGKKKRAKSHPKKQKTKKVHGIYIGIYI